MDLQFPSRQTFTVLIVMSIFHFELYLQTGDNSLGTYAGLKERAGHYYFSLEDLQSVIACVL